MTTGSETASCRSKDGLEICQRSLFFAPVLLPDSFPSALPLPVSPDERRPQENDEYGDGKSESPSRKSTVHAGAVAALT